MFSFKSTVAIALRRWKLYEFNPGGSCFFVKQSVVGTRYIDV